MDKHRIVITGLVVVAPNGIGAHFTLKFPLASPTQYQDLEQAALCHQQSNEEET